jgi:hypothetical protein
MTVKTFFCFFSSFFMMTVSRNHSWFFNINFENITSLYLSQKNHKICEQSVLGIKYMSSFSKTVVQNIFFFTEMFCSMHTETCTCLHLEVLNISDLSENWNNFVWSSEVSDYVKILPSGSCAVASVWTYGQTEWA